MGPYDITCSGGVAPNYNINYVNGTLAINQAVPTITWQAPAGIDYGTALSSTQLNATASVLGAFVYTPSAGAVLEVGTQALSATFTPTDVHASLRQPGNECAFGAEDGELVQQLGRCSFTGNFGLGRRLRDLGGELCQFGAEQLPGSKASPLRTRCFAKIQFVVCEPRQYAISIWPPENYVRSSALGAWDSYVGACGVARRPCHNGVQV